MSLTLLFSDRREVTWRNQQVLEMHLRQAGVRLADCKIAFIPNLPPSGVIVAFGDAAARFTIPTWPAEGVAMPTRRGYAWESPFAKIGVISSQAPSAVDREWVPWSPLLAKDLWKAKELARRGKLERPERNVRVVQSIADAERSVQTLRRSRVLAADIENYDEHTLACIGFASSSRESVVFPARYLKACRSLLEAPEVTFIWQNGVYDLYFLLTRCGVRVAGGVEDTLLQWHCLSPELAGAAVGPKAGARRRTAKSLAFLVSLYTFDPWWKDYDFVDDSERFHLNGMDCCVTYDIWEQQREHIKAQGVQEIYQHEVGLMWPVTEMHTRGMKVDTKLRDARVAELSGRLEGFQAKLNALVMPLLEERSDRLTPEQLALFQQIEGVCKCCRHAAKKQLACWGCAGFEKAPSKADMVDYAILHGYNPAGCSHPSEAGKMKKAELEAWLLETCRVCRGQPRREWLEFNPNSTPQTCIVLYDLLKMPKKFNGGSLTADEGALKDLLGQIGDA